MNKGKRRETKFDEQQLAREVCLPGKSAHRALKVLGVAAATMAAIGLITQWQDIRRYVRMVRM